MKVGDIFFDRAAYLENNVSESTLVSDNSCSSIVS